MKRSSSMRKSASAASSSSNGASSVASTSQHQQGVSNGSGAAGTSGTSGLTAPRSPVLGPPRQMSLSVPSSPNRQAASVATSSNASTSTSTETGSLPHPSTSGGFHNGATPYSSHSNGYSHSHTQAPSSYPNHRYPHSPNPNPSIRLPRPSEAFARELSDVLQHTFIPSILPTAEEYQIKESARKFLETLAERVSPGAKLLPFGSQANGMALKNSGKRPCIRGSGEEAEAACAQNGSALNTIRLETANVQ